MFSLSNSRALVALLLLLLTAMLLAPATQAQSDDGFTITEMDVDVADEPDTGDAIEEEPVILDKDAISKLKIKQLRSMLEERGQECKGCVDKTDFVERVLEVQDMPIVQKAKVELPKDRDSKISQKELDDLLASMKGSGFGNAKVFSADDLKNLDPSKFSTSGGSSGGKRKSKRNWHTTGDEKKSRGKRASEL